MKKILIVIVAIFLFNANAQNNIIVQQNQTKTSSSNQDEEVCVNGVPISEDIGGVECAKKQNWEIDPKYEEFNKKDPKRWEYKYRKDRGQSLLFTNYNDITVTVNFEVFITTYNTKSCRYGTIVLKSGETKESSDRYGNNDSKIDVKLVVRPLGQKAKTTKSTTKKKRK